MIAVVGIAAAGLGSGFLLMPINLTVQEMGAGSAVIETPIDNAAIDFELQKLPDENGVVKNRITHCSFHSPDTMPAVVIDPTPGDPNSGDEFTGMYKIFCKLTDDPVTHNVLTEGDKELAEYIGSTTLFIKIDEPFPAVEEVMDVTLVVQGFDPTPPVVCGDLIDNDMDGSVDEEAPGGLNGIDDDGDGLIDEDC